MTLTQMPPNQEAPGSSSNQIKTPRHFFDKKFWSVAASCFIGGTVLGIILLVLSGGHSATTLSDTTGSPVVVPAPVATSPALPTLANSNSNSGANTAPASSGSCSVTQPAGLTNVQDIANVLLKQRALGFAGNRACIEQAWPPGSAAVQEDLTRGVQYAPVDHIDLDPNNASMDSALAGSGYGGYGVSSTGVHYTLVVSFTQQGGKWYLADVYVMNHG